MASEGREASYIQPARSPVIARGDMSNRFVASTLLTASPVLALIVAAAGAGSRTMAAPEPAPSSHPATSGPSTASIESLLDQLSARDYRARQKAQDTLVAQGDAAA